MKHWLMATILLATIMLAGCSGCTETGQKVKQKAPPKCTTGRCYPDSKAREGIIQNRGAIDRTQKQLKELRDRSMTSDKEAKDSISMEATPVPIPVIPVPRGQSPRLPSTRINKSKKFTLYEQVPYPDPIPNPDGPTEPPCPPESKYKIHLV